MFIGICEFSVLQIGHFIIRPLGLKHVVHHRQLSEFKYDIRKSLSCSLLLFCVDILVGCDQAFRRIIPLTIFVRLCHFELFHKSYLWYLSHWYTISDLVHLSLHDLVVSSIEYPEYLGYPAFVNISYYNSRNERQSNANMENRS